METKTCSLTESEIKAVMQSHAMSLVGQLNLEPSPSIYDIDETIDRMNYLNKRLKAKPKDDKPEEQPKAQMSPEETKATTSW